MKALDVISLSIYSLNFIFIITLLFFRRKSPNQTMVWLLALYSFPVLGFIFYLVFGRGMKTYTRKRYELKEHRDRAYSKVIKEYKDLIENHRVQFNDLAVENYTDIIKMFFYTSKSLYTQDNEITLYTHANDKYEALMVDIENAKETVNILYFIIKNDHTGNRLVNLLAQKAAEGVEVRLLYDDFGSLLTPSKMFKKLEAAGGKVCRFFPIAGGAYLNINHRNHRKIVVIDGKIGFLGGMNIGDEYMGQGKIGPWRDTHLRITGSAVWMLQERFIMDWNFSSKQMDDLEDPKFFQKYFAQVENPGKTGIQIVSSGPDASGEEIKSGFIKMIYSARERIYIQTPYFVPDAPFLDALRTAVASGVDVRIMIPGVPDKKYVWNVSMSYVRDLLEAGVKVYLYQGFIHAKMVVMDDKIVSIGTTNIDIRSFVLHFEVNAFIYDTTFASTCQEIFEKDQAQSTFVTIKWYNSRGLFVTMRESFYRLFSPLM